MCNESNIKITISCTKFKENCIEITKLYKIVTNSDDNSIEYMYIIFYSKTYEIYASFLNKPIHCNQERIRSEIYKWTKNQCIIENTNMSNKELYEYISGNNNSDVNIYPIKPIHVQNIKSSLHQPQKQPLNHSINQQLIQQQFIQQQVIQQQFDQQQFVQQQLDQQQLDQRQLDQRHINSVHKCSGVYLIDSVKHYKLGSTCNIYKRLCTHATSLGIPNVRLIIYTEHYKLLESVLLHKFKKYLVTHSREMINMDLITIHAIIHHIIEVCDVLDIDYTPDYNYKFIKHKKN